MTTDSDSDYGSRKRKQWKLCSALYRERKRRKAKQLTYCDGLFRFEDVLADGDCFYHCLSKFIGIDPVTIRSMVASYVLTHIELMRYLFNLLNMDVITFDDHVSQMNIRYRWVNVFDIHVAALCYDRNIIEC